MDKRSNNIDHLLTVIASGLPMKINLEIDVELEAKEVDARATETTGISRSVHGKLQADYQQLKYDFQKMKSDLTYAVDDHGVMKADKRKVKSLLVIAEADNKWLRSEILKLNPKWDGEAKENKKEEKKPVKKRRAKLLDEEVWRIRRFIKMGRKNIWIERHMGLPSSLISNIKSNKAYASVPPEPKKKPTLVRAGEGVLNEKVS